jgi:hypothetical protein
MLMNLGEGKGSPMTDTRACVVAAPGAGAALEPGPGRPAIKVGPPPSTPTGLPESELPPGGGFGVPHWHEDLDEGRPVLDGETDYLFETPWRRAPAGTSHRSPYAHRRPSGPRADHAGAGGPATAPGGAGATG